MSTNWPVWRYIQTLLLVLYPKPTLRVFGLTVAVQPPSGDPAAGSVMESAVRRSQADRIYVICEVDRGRELQEADVVVDGQQVVQGVAHDPFNGPRLFLWV